MKLSAFSDDRSRNPSFLVAPPASPAWGCSLFSVLQDQEAFLFGRNFDWRYSPALLLDYQPSHGYQSVSMVDLAYLFDEEQVGELDTLPLDARVPLLDAYLLPFDGMNAAGLVIGMAAVPESGLPQNPNLEELGSLAIMRRILDEAGTVEEAIGILSAVRPSWGQGPALHYMISDRMGNSTLVEFIDGEVIFLEAQGDYQVATNFLQRSSTQSQSGHCWRFDQLDDQLRDRERPLSMLAALDLLNSVSQSGGGSSTQWSIIYNFSSGEVNISMGIPPGAVHQYHLPLVEGVMP
jgi:hypothetical protein